MNKPSLLRRLLTGALLSVSALHAGAQAWPTKPIMMVVPWPAGGPSAFVTRKLQPDLAKALGRPLVIDNIGGAGGAIGVQMTVSAAADGHTLTMAARWN